MYYTRHLYRIRQEIWLNAWPRSILFILSMVQFWSTWLIIGLETWHGVLDYRHSFAFIGLITSIFFTISWVATMSMVCCHRDSVRCANYTISSNIVSIVAAVVLIYFDATFIRNPSTCLSIWKDCTLTNDEYLLFRDNKILLIKIQLSLSSVLLTSNVIFAIMYLIARIKLRYRTKIRPAPATLELDEGSLP